ncbi:MAG: cell division protein ZapA [Bacteroidia bacterium]|nr:cell division protein ZapA [Bacteroidia bacterium]MCZ2248969.1 cell division protein ZapA [Bacteroidia bacterium]
MSNLTVNLNIAGRNYPLKVKEGDIDKFKEAEEMINSKIALYERNFSVKDKQDLLAMCLINLANEILNKNVDISNFNEIAHQINDTEQYITDYLTKVVL